MPDQAKFCQGVSYGGELGQVEENPIWTVINPLGYGLVFIPTCV